MSGINPPEIAQALDEPEPLEHEPAAPDEEPDASDDTGIEHGSEEDPDDR